MVVLDGCIPAPAELVEEACALRFEPIGPHYPGVRAVAPAARLDLVMPALAAPIARVFGLGARLHLLEAYYSIVTTPPSALEPIQRLPHFDGLEDTRIAFLLFLAGGECGGTAFYRHRTTGYETVGATRFDTYRAAVGDDVARLGLPQAAYIDGDTMLFEQTLRIAGKWNRALIYRGNMLHCADLPRDFTYQADPRRGRLTLNVFLAGH